MREWLRGGVQPCQGWGRGFESRLALYWKPECVSIPVFALWKNEISKIKKFPVFIKIQGFEKKVLAR